MKVIKLVSASFENFKKLNWTVEFGEKKHRFCYESDRKV